MTDTARHLEDICRDIIEAAATAAVLQECLDRIAGRDLGLLSVHIASEMAWMRSRIHALAFDLCRPMERIQETIDFAREQLELPATADLPTQTRRPRRRFRATKAEIVAPPAPDIAPAPARPAPPWQHTPRKASL